MAVRKHDAGTSHDKTVDARRLRVEVSDADAGSFLAADRFLPQIALDRTDL